VVLRFLDFASRPFGVCVCVCARVAGMGFHQGSEGEWSWRLGGRGGGETHSGGENVVAVM